jgi:hypothetical protein
VNPRTRRAALYAIGVIAIAASVNALTHSYAGLYDWAIGHRLAGWQAMSWPAEIDVFLAIGELSLYVAYLDAWPARQRVWPWATALIGLSVSVAGNIGHVQPAPGHPVILADRLTAATSPLAAFAGLYVGLLVLKMTRPHAQPGHEQPLDATNQLAHLAHPDRLGLVLTQPADVPARSPGRPATTGSEPASGPPGVPADTAPGRHGLMREATRIYQAAAANGDRISQRALARQLRQGGHRFSNEHLHGIAATIGMTTQKAA